MRLRKCDASVCHSGRRTRRSLLFVIINPTRVGNDFILSFNTQTGFNYTAEISDSILHPNWNAFATVPGNGGALTVTNYDVPIGPRFYRVRIP
jgi:hypothetical protein